MSDNPDPTSGERPADDPDQRPTNRQWAVGSGDSRIGKVFGGRYRIEDRIGAGGMGVVYRARQTGLDRSVVVKVLTQERLQDDTSLQRFEREAKSLSRLDHLNIVTVYDFGREGELTYLAMEYVDGVELHSLIEQQGWLSMNLFSTIASQILDGVGHAHSNGLVHRDLKPSNIMLTERDESPYFVKLLDFGLAKLVSGDVDVTQKDSILGSIPYLSPEQIAGSDIDQRVDVYSLGIVFYYMLTGRKPFRGSEASIVYDQVHSEPPPITLHLPDNSRVPKPVTELIHACLAKSPDNRPDSAYAVLERLQAVTNAFQPPSSGSHRRPSSAPASDASGSREQAASSEYVENPQTQNSSQHGDSAQAPRSSDGGAPGQSTPTNQPTANVDESGADESTGGSNSGLIIGVVVGLMLAGTAAGTYYLTSQSSGDSSSSRASSEKSDSFGEKLSQVDSLIEEKKFSTASSELDTLAAEASGDQQSQKIESRRQQLRAARLFAKADRQQQTGDIDKAISTYSELLEILPDFRDASDRLSELEAYGEVTLETDREAEVEIDGDRVGESPVTSALAPGEHEVTVETDEGDTWSDTVTVGEDEMVTLEPEFEQDRGGGGSAPSRGGSGGRAEADDSTAAGGTEPSSQGGSAPSGGEAVSASGSEEGSESDDDEKQASESDDDGKQDSKSTGAKSASDDSSEASGGDDSVLLESGSEESSETDSKSTSPDDDGDDTELLPVN
jgi:serine/threonine protein kinase